MSGLGQCEAFIEAISARLDGEELGMSRELLEAHLATCASCQTFAAQAEAQRNRFRIRPVPDPVPDLVDRILEVVAELPPPRTPKRLTDRRLLGALALAATVFAGVAAGFLGGGLLQRPSPSPSHGSGQGAVIAETDRRFPGALVYPATMPAIREPSVALTDVQGRPYDVATATKGRITLLYFGYTHCPDVCPINMELTSEALRDLPGRLRRDVTVVFITTDPRRDTAEVIGRWLDTFDHSLPPFVGLRGSLTQIHEAEQEVRMPLSYAQTAPREEGGYTIVHAGYVLVYSRNGIADMQVDDTETPADYARTIEDLLSERDG